MAVSSVPVSREQDHLPAEIAERINAEHQACEQAARSALEHARTAGGLLQEAKEMLPHGQWEPWIEESCVFSARTARMYMQVARHWPELEERQRVADLSLREAVKLLSTPRSEVENTDPKGRWLSGEGTLPRTYVFDETGHKVTFVADGLRFDELGQAEWQFVFGLIRDMTLQVTRSLLECGRKILDAERGLTADEYRKLVQELLVGLPVRKLRAIASDARILGQPIRNLPADLEALYLLTRLTDDEWEAVEPDLSWRTQPKEINRRLFEHRRAVRVPA